MFFAREALNMTTVSKIVASFSINTGNSGCEI